MLGSIIHVNSVTKKENEGYWIIQLKLCGKDDHNYGNATAHRSRKYESISFSPCMCITKENMLGPFDFWIFFI
jgi:hypothetical protein